MRFYYSSHFLAYKLRGNEVAEYVIDILPLTKQKNIALWVIRK